MILPTVDEGMKEVLGPFASDRTIFLISKHYRNVFLDHADGVLGSPDRNVLAALIVIGLAGTGQKENWSTDNAAGYLKKLPVQWQ